MLGFTIRYLAYSVSMVVIYVVIERLYNRGTINKGNQTDTHYDIRIPAALGYVYGAMFVLGMVIFVFVFICHLYGVESADVGMMRFGLIFALIRLVVMVWAKCWRVSIDGPNIRIYRLFQRSKELKFSDISKVLITKKFRIDVYRGNKRIIKVNILCDNHARFEKSLIEYGKLEPNH